MSANNELKVYLGDGAYADFENGMIKVTTEDGISVGNVIYLEEDVFNALVKYGSRVFPRNSSGVTNG